MNQPILETSEVSVELFPENFLCIRDGNHVWKRGDAYMNGDGKLEYVPDLWHLEDKRQNEVIYRPI